MHAPFDVRLDELPGGKRPMGPYELRVRTELAALSPGSETRIGMSPIATHHFPIARIKGACELAVSRDKSVLGRCLSGRLSHVKVLR